MTFTVKPIHHDTSLGSRFRELRESQGFTVQTMVQKTNIQRAYLSAIESEAWHLLPEEPSQTLLMKRYLQALGNDPSLFALLQKKSEALDKPVLRRLEAKTPFWTSHHLKLACIGMLFLGLIGYLSVEVYTLLAPPFLTLESPPDRFPTDVPTILVKGKTETVASVTVNNQLIIKNPDGSFEQMISLNKGVNIIAVEASKRYSKPRSVYRSVIYEGTVSALPREPSPVLIP